MIIYWIYLFVNFECFFSLYNLFNS